MTQIKDILFLDIETVPEFETYDKMPEAGQIAFQRAMKSKIKANELVRDGSEYYHGMFDDLMLNLYHENAGFMPEFAKIVCISVGKINNDQIEIKTLSQDSNDPAVQLEAEKDMLISFKDICSGGRVLAAHYGKGFDFPFIAKRMLKYGIMPPEQLKTWGKKPWEIMSIDTMELWQFGDYKNHTSLVVLAHHFGLPSPKDDIDGSEVAGVYYGEEDGLDRICAYCEKDVVTLINVYLSMLGSTPLNRALL